MNESESDQTARKDEDRRDADQSEQGGGPAPGSNPESGKSIPPASDSGPDAGSKSTGDASGD